MIQIEPGFKFDPEKHQYFLDDKAIPNVTSILPRPDYLDRIQPDELERARLRGKRHHAIIAAVASGQPLPFEPTEEDLIFQWAFEDFFDEEMAGTIGLPIAVEQPLVDRKRKFAGTPDIVFKRAILDAKLSFGDLRYHALQLAAYNLLAGIKCRIWLIVETKGGEFRFRNVFNEQAEAVFLDLLSAFRIFENYHKYLSQK